MCRSLRLHLSPGLDVTPEVSPRLGCLAAFPTALFRGSFLQLGRSPEVNGGRLAISRRAACVGACRASICVPPPLQLRIV